MRVLVTGGAGFIGSHIAQVMTEAGHDVVCVWMSCSPKHWPDATAPEGLVVEGVRDRVVLDGLLLGVDAVCHQAAIVDHGWTAQILPTTPRSTITAHGAAGRDVLPRSE